MELTKADLRDWQKLREHWRFDPESYAVHRLGLHPTHQQAELLRAIAPGGAKVSVRAGHGVGKSGATSAAIWWMLECFDYPKVPCTAPSAAQLRQVLWSEIAKWSRASDELARKQGLPDALRLGRLFTINQDEVVDNGAPKEWFAVARTARKENPDALQGFHASDLTVSADGRSIVSVGEGGQLFFVVEEAPGVDDRIFEVAEGALSSRGARLLMVGNPTRNKGYFARSHRENRAQFTTLHFSCADSPLVDANYRANLVRSYGEGSNVVRVRADGEFPRQDDDALIALEYAEAALARDDVQGDGRRILGVDVARFGDDRTVFLSRRGRVVERIEIRAKQDTMQTAGQAMVFWRDWRADAIHVDTDGLGAGVADRLREQGAPVVDVHAGSTAPDRQSGGIEAQPLRMRDFLWLAMMAWVRDEAPSIVNDQAGQDLAGELSSVTYALNSSGKIVVESKDEMKRRGLRSPDIADALGLTFAPDEDPLAVWAALGR